MEYYEKLKNIQELQHDSESRRLELEKQLNQYLNSDHRSVCVFPVCHQFCSIKTALRQVAFVPPLAMTIVAFNVIVFRPSATVSRIGLKTITLKATIVIARGGTNATWRRAVLIEQNW